jgi:hypothetical protein
MRFDGKNRGHNRGNRGERMQKRPETFKFRVSNDERREIAKLAERLSRSQSDAVRFVVIEAAKQLAHSEPITGSTMDDTKQLEGKTYGSEFIPN